MQGLGTSLPLTVGADPELFLKLNDAFISAHNRIPGTKEAPHPVKDGAVQVDGMALEFNINPAKNSKEFVNNINSVLKTLRSMIPNGYKTSIVATATFAEGQMNRTPLKAQALGCDVDWNAYAEQNNNPPDQHSNMRTAAGHVHIGWEDVIGVNSNETLHMKDCFMLAIQMDYFLGLPSIIKDRDRKRREMYGTAGAFRPKPYGMEYRVLSNFWLRTNTLKTWVFDATHEALYQLILGNDMGEEYGREAAVAIDSGNVEDAIAICKKAGIHYDL